MEPTGRSNRPVEPTGVEPTGVEPTGVDRPESAPPASNPRASTRPKSELTGVEPTGVDPTGVEFVDPAKNESQAFGMVFSGTWSIPAPAFDGAAFTVRFDSPAERAAP